ncbi:uncharacterized protein LTR77_006596 [Saxophila tyrrhenica]|uniref:Zn(2)-C6 fungal-type domain-containing protein n=1 Tax=Saxophila tyrrhenica TaxID=1690608 RepID=A0AAV9P592_9PEZI|nr:hypothetical protein LTR77_006596 [Saxophila tyrrhenica]
MPPSTLDKAGAQLDEQPESCHSPSMQYFHPHHVPPEHYRASPQQDHEHKQPTSTSHTPLLPPIGDFNGQMMQTAQPQYATVAMNGQMQQPPPPPAHHHHPPPTYHAPQYHYANGMPPTMPSNVGVNGQNGGALPRYALPPQMMVGPNPRPKKDIKRRTKTGCLTCRKRRIKCDEHHPTCRNCQKSKRECMGYDPIFKPQPGPTHIQPAPSAHPNLKVEQSPQDSAVPPSAYRPSHPYSATESAFSTGSTSPRNMQGQAGYVDPALGGGEPPSTMNNFNSALQPERRVRRVSIDHLFSINDVPPRFHPREAPPVNSEALQHEAEDFYRLHFAPGLDKLFETNWYSERGPHHLQQDRPLLDYTMQVVERMRPRPEDFTAIQQLQSLEARLVWQLAAMPRSPLRHEANGATNDPLASQVIARIDTLENLLTGQFLPPSRIPQAPSQDHQQDHRKYNEQHFWHLLGRFTSARDDTADPHAAREVNESLAAMRASLGMLENRDVLYSIAVARHVGGRLQDFHPPRPVIAQTDDPNDEVKKLQVAQSFISQEDQKGTTQVIQRVCSMAMRSWVLQKQQ